MISCGVDIGSTTIEALVMEDGKIRAMEMAATGACPPETALRVLERALAHQGLKRTDVGHLLATGIGREQLAGADSTASEIACHASGAARRVPGARTVIDIGGQDSKVIALEPDGRVRDFAMNDRCAAGTGRFLEGIARTLALPLESIGEVPSPSDTPSEISAMCAVFAETEIIGLIHNGASRGSVLLGAFRAVGRRVLGMAQRIGIRDVVVMTGGVARNAGVVAALQALTGHEIIVPDMPHFTGALGAAVIAAGRAAKGGDNGRAGRGDIREEYGQSAQQYCVGSRR